MNFTKLLTLLLFIFNSNTFTLTTEQKIHSLQNLINEVAHLYNWEKNIIPKFNINIEANEDIGIANIRKIDIENNTATITIVKNIWNKFSDEAKKYVIAHEIAHFIQRKENKPNLKIAKITKSIADILLLISFIIPFSNLKKENHVKAIFQACTILSLQNITKNYIQRILEYDADIRAIKVLKTTKGAEETLNFFSESINTKKELFKSGIIGKTCYYLLLKPIELIIDHSQTHPSPNTRLEYMKKVKNT